MSITIVECDSPSAETKWDRYVLDCPTSTGYHLTAWRHVIRVAFGHRDFYFMAQDNQGNIQGVIPMILLSSRLFGRFLVSLPFLNYGGLLWKDEAAKGLLVEHMINKARELGANHIELRHQERSDFGWVLHQRKVSMRVQLPEQFEILWKGFPSKLRSQIRRGQKEGMAVRFGGMDCLDEFYGVFARCMRDLGTPVYSKCFFSAILKTFPKEASICLVCRNGETLAAGFLYGFRNSLEIPWAASDKQFNRLAPNMLLYGSVLEHACKEGFREFDFGRSSPDSGTYRFKEQWGAQPHQLHWYYWVKNGGELPQLNPQNPKYDLAIKAWQRLPLVVANWLGPHIVKYLP